MPNNATGAGMRFLQHAARGACAAAAIFGTVTASGQAYPNKVVRIVAGESGGGADFAARLIAHGLTAGFGQQVIVENRGGASGVIAAELVARAPPDGHTLLLFSSSFWTLPLMQSVSYDPVRDFVPITLALNSPNILVVHPSLPVKSVRDLIALARARPGELNYGMGSAGSAGHIGAELFKNMAGIDIVRVPYKGSGSTMNALMVGEVHLFFAGAGSAAPHLRSGRLKGLAITSAQPSVLLPGLPTIAASGLEGYECAVQTGIFAPARTADAIVTRLNQEIIRVLTSVDVKRQFAITGVETVGSSTAEFGDKIRSDVAKLTKLIRDTGIRSR
jgi:tripartite-type tricarboxylate transporter receptor subunit TctC